jgi:hypothetical protein
VELLYTVDRREGTWVVLEDESGSTFQVPMVWLPAEAREGDVVRVTAQPDSTRSAPIWLFELAPELREARRRDATMQRQKLPRGPEGDLSL